MARLGLGLSQEECSLKASTTRERTPGKRDSRGGEAGLA
jgi:hypothetical protein